MVLQYLYIGYTTLRYRRPLSVLVTILANFVFWFAAAFLTGSASAKLGLAYSGLALEFVVALLLPFVPGYINAPAAEISERYGALTLIILGEGIISLVQSLSDAIAGFGFTHSQCMSSSDLRRFVILICSL